MRWLILNLDTLLLPAAAGGQEDWDQRQPDPAALSAAARLVRSGHHLVLITTQHERTESVVSLCKLHARINEALSPLGGRIEASLYCPHGPGLDCDCRTPQPGLLRSLGERLEISLAATTVVSCREEDLQAAQAVGALGVNIEGSQPPTCATHRTARPRLEQWVDAYLGANPA